MSHIDEKAIADKLQAFLKDECGIAAGKISGSTPLFTSSLLSSLDLLDLVAFIEETFGLTLPAMDVSLDAFDTVDRTAAFIRERL